jgi:hypothetical protein
MTGTPLLSIWDRSEAWRIDTRGPDTKEFGSVSASGTAPVPISHVAMDGIFWR